MTPRTPEELADGLLTAASAGQTITLAGAGSKRRMGGPIEPSAVSISTAGMTRVLQYEPRDLTISVEAGLPYRELRRILAENRQMIPLDPPFSDTATVGGVLATNGSGPRRRLYGTARDMVIGMKFATLEGKLVRTGGMVVKNVAGLDMAKLMIGSFGTLAAIATVNFKLMPMPAHERTFLLSCDALAEAVNRRNVILKSVLQPAALDLIRREHQGYTLAVQVGGNTEVIERYQRELSELGALRTLEGDEEAAFWSEIREFTPRFLQENPEGAVVRVSSTLADLHRVIECARVPVIARAGSGVAYVYFPRAEDANGWTAEAVRQGWKAVIEFAPEAKKSALDLWPSPGPEFEMMKKVKGIFDPRSLLNRGRLYRHI